MAFLLGIDLGTTAVKSALFSDAGALVGQASAEYDTYYPHENAAEQMPDDWWTATVRTVQAVLQATKVKGETIAAISVSSQAPTMLPLDQNGRPLHPALIWMDQRADEACQFLREVLGEETMFRVTGNTINSYYVLPELLWFKHKKPDLYAQTFKIIQVNGYINLKLTGRYTIDRAHAGLTLLYNIHTQQWAHEIFEAVDLPVDLFPPICECHAVIGEVTAAAAQETGLKPGTKVVAGTVDGTAAALEAGTISDGHVCEMTGTSTVILAASTRIITDRQLTFLPHAVKGVSLLIGTMSSTGASLKWFRNQLGLEERNAGFILEMDPYDVMNLELERASDSPSGIIFLPYLAGERSPIWDNTARGVLFGLSANTKRAQLIKALMEGAAFGLKHNLEVLKEGGLTVTEIRTVGGGAKSAVWNQIKADITNTPILIPETAIGAPFGDVVLGGYGVGIFTDIQATLNQLVKIRKVYEPQARHVEVYQELFEIYKDLYLHLKTDFKRLHELKLKFQTL